MQYEYLSSFSPPVGFVTISASQKHMKILNLLVLFLVTGGSGDILTIFLYKVKKKRIKLYCEKNKLYT